jgi:hypothetical protein
LGIQFFETGEVFLKGNVDSRKAQCSVDSPFPWRHPWEIAEGGHTEMGIFSRIESKVVHFLIEAF